MFKSVKLNAEQQFAATQKKGKQALEEKEKVRQEGADHVSKLRGLRLAKEAADKKIADKAALEKLAAKTKKKAPAAAAAAQASN